MKLQIKLAFASGTDELNRRLIERMQSIYPELPLWVVSDFPPAQFSADKTLKWIPYRIGRSLALNLARTRAALHGVSIRLAGVMLVPNVPFRRMRLMALLLSPRGFIAFNENLDNFMLRPGSIPAMLSHVGWRIGNRLRAKTGPADPEPVEAPASATSFPGRSETGKPRILIASPYLPFPLSHGGAVRMYNLMRRASADFDQVLIAFSDGETALPKEVLDICAETILVPHTGRHEYPEAGRPDTVEEYDSPVFRAALRDAVARWKPAVAQLEFTQMAQYAADCAPAQTILVEHDITFDLYQQRLAMASEQEDQWELAHQTKLWRNFERGAWHRVTRVVTMSDKDRKLVGPGAVTLPNGVDLERFRPTATPPDPRRLLFIGSFAHLPNLLALEFFLTEVWPRVWPRLDGVTLHIISGARHEYFLDFYRHRVTLDLNHPGLEVEGFVSDVRPAYTQAALVVAPLLASAGTNIKVLEAMAMGKVTVSTSAGINGLDLTDGHDVVIADTAEAMAAAITELLDHPERRHAIETAARQTVERDFGWDPIARRQAELYRELAH